jgi:hypothetical protein
MGGVQKYFPNGQVTLGGTPYTTAQLVELFQSYINALAASEAAEAARSAAVKAARQTASKVLPVHRQLLAYVKTVLGSADTVLADFGETAHARKTPTVEVKAAAKQKRQATRAVRHTMGKVQKKAVKGSASTPAQPSAAPAPAK